MSEKNKKMVKEPETNTEETKTAAVVVAPKQALAPNYEDMAGLGGEELEAADMTIPTIKLVQGISKEAMKGVARAGDWMNNISEQIYGKEISVVVLQVLKGWAIFGEKGTPDEGKMLARLFNNGIIPTYNPELIEEQNANGEYTGRVKPHLLEWSDGKDGGADRPPIATLFYTYLVLVNGEDFGNITLMKSALKPAKKFNTLLKLKNEALFCNKFTFATEYKEDGQNKYYAPVIRPAGKTDDDIRKKCYDFLMSIRNTGIKLQEDHNASGEGAEEQPF